MTRCRLAAQAGGVRRPALQDVGRGGVVLVRQQYEQCPSDRLVLLALEAAGNGLVHGGCYVFRESYTFEGIYTFKGEIFSE